MGHGARGDHEEVEVQCGGGGVILRQTEEGCSVGEVCREAGISRATFYVCRKSYAGLTPSETNRLRQFEDDNGRLKLIVVDLSPRQADDNAFEASFNGSSSRISEHRLAHGPRRRLAQNARLGAQTITSHVPTARSVTSARSSL
ncbi:transposase [uncultured Caulobacter sp.]|uniref:transposase n=1 Tax=uncultured Caulobacter sp. TaxID=158749 RepID=UPI00344E1916